MAAGVLLLAGATHAWQVLVAFVLLRLAGQGAIGVGLLAAVVRRFSARRGRRLSIANLGYAAGEVVFPSLVLALISLAGWKSSLLAIGGAYLFLALPGLAWLFARSSRGPAIDAPADVARSVSPGEGTSVAGALRTPAFWIALFTFSVLPIVVTALFFHQVAIFRIAGMGEALAPIAFAGFAVGHAAAMGAIGHYIDGLSFRASAIVSSLCVLAAIGIMYTSLDSLGAAVAYGVLLGCGSAVSSLAGALVWPRLFGTAAVGRIRAISSGLRNGATAAGPLLVIIRPGMSVLGSVGPLALLVLAGLVAAVWLPGNARRHAR